MTQKKYVDKTGLSNFLARLKEAFAAKGHTHDDRYYTETEMNTKLDAKVPTSRTVNGKALSTNISLTASDVGAAASGHTHDDRYYTETEMDSKLSGKVDNTNAGLNTVINKLSTGSATPTDDDYYVSQYVGGGTTTITYHRRPMSALWSYVKGKADSTYQAKGNYAAASHTHDDRYYTETEIDTKLDGKANSSHTHTKSQITDFAHTHDDRYYTETEMDSKLSGKANSSHNHSAANITSGTLSADRLPSIPVGKLEGVIDSSNLPSYVDDVLEYTSKSNFPTAGETGKIYVDTTTNLTYRWSGSAYVEISPSLALGETSATAYRGDRGKAAYEHSQATGNPHGTTIADISSLQSTLDSKVPTSRTVNGKALSANISLTASDVGASASNHTHSYLPLSGGTVTGMIYQTKAGSADIGIEAKNTDTNAAVRLQVGSGKYNRGVYDMTASKWMLYSDQNNNVILNGNAATATNATTANSATSATKATSLAPVTTAGDGAAYTATVNGITALTVGANFIMNPHVLSTSTTPTLNVNGLGAKTIRVQLSNSSSTAVAPAQANFLGPNKPVEVVYNGSYWVVQLIRPDASTIYGTVAIAKGGTGATTAEKARVNLGISTANGTTISSNADYAEVGEWADGNSSDENRIGYFVAIDDTSAGTTMVKAKSTSDVRGVTVAAPAFSGNCSSDKFDSNGNLLKQYDYVGVMGLVSVIDNGTCTINGRCMPNDNGTAVPSPNNLGYQVVNRIDTTHILIAVEPNADMLVRIKEDISTLQKKNHVGSTDTSSKIFLVGATSQAANPQTYSDNEIYATSGALTTKEVQVGGGAAKIQYDSTNKCINFVFA